MNIASLLQPSEIDADGDRAMLQDNDVECAEC